MSTKYTCGYCYKAIPKDYKGHISVIAFEKKQPQLFHRQQLDRVEPYGQGKFKDCYTAYVFKSGKVTFANTTTVEGLEKLLKRMFPA